MFSAGIVVALAIATAGCRVGGPSYEASPDDPLDASADARADTSVAPEGAAPAADAGGGEASAGDAAQDDAGDDGGCNPPAPVEVCDPVCNTGCMFLSRCNI